MMKRPVLRQPQRGILFLAAHDAPEGASSTPPLPTEERGQLAFEGGLRARLQNQSEPAAYRRSVVAGGSLPAAQATLWIFSSR